MYRFPRPRFGKIQAAIAYSGIGRSKLYDEAKKRTGLFRKNGAATVVDFDILDIVLDELPLATFETDAKQESTDSKGAGPPSSEAPAFRVSNTVFSGPEHRKRRRNSRSG
jgi:hypothetical protein